MQGYLGHDANGGKMKNAPSALVNNLGITNFLSGDDRDDDAAQDANGDDCHAKFVSSRSAHDVRPM